MEYLTKAQMTSLDLSSLSDEKRQEILSLKNDISLDSKGIMDFGSSAVKGMNDFSTAMLKTMQIKDFPEIDAILGELMGELQKVDSNTLLSYKPPFWKKLFGMESMEKFINNFKGQFESVYGVIDSVKKRLEDAKFQLNKDITLCEKYMEQNLKHINELDACVFAGRLKLNEVREEIESEMVTLDKQDELAVHMMSEKQSAENRLEISVRDLSLMRENAVQKMHQMRLIKDGDTVLIEKIDKSINIAIPMWESQMLTAFVVARQQSCIDMEKAIYDMSNNLAILNSELVKAGAIQIAQELQKGIMDIEVLKSSTQKLIETFNEVKKINIEGKEKRRAEIEELGRITIGLNEAALIESKDL